ncbi:MAG: hypothetical protein ACI923_001943, partial [Flavobacteriales bacterium]
CCGHLAFIIGSYSILSYGVVNDRRSIFSFQNKESIH